MGIEAIAEMIKFIDREPEFVSALQEARLKARAGTKTKRKKKTTKQGKRKKVLRTSDMDEKMRNGLKTIGIKVMEDILKVSIEDDANIA